MAIGAPGFNEHPSAAPGAASAAQAPGRARRQDPAVERRRHRRRRTTRSSDAPKLQAGDLRARHPQRDRPDHPSGDRRALGDRERSAGRRRGQHHPRRQELRLADRHLRTRLLRPIRKGRIPACLRRPSSRRRRRQAWWNRSRSTSRRSPSAGMVFYTGDKFPTWRGNLIVGGLIGMQLVADHLQPAGARSPA